MPKRANSGRQPKHRNLLRTLLAWLPQQFRVRPLELVLPANLLLFSWLPAQGIEDELRSLLASGEQARAQALVQSLQQKSPQSAEALFFSAWLEPDAAKAIKRYNDVVLLHRNSPFAARSLYRVGLYHFSTGFFYPAHKLFIEILRSYPTSEVAAHAHLYAAQCLIAFERTDEAMQALEALLAKKPEPAVAELAEAELRSLRTIAATPQPPAAARAMPPVQMPVETPAPQRETPRSEAAREQAKPYTLQIGAYTNPENARSQQSYFSLLGHQVEIRRERVRQTLFYKVYLGSFATRAEAEQFAVAFQRRYNTPYHIVKLQDE